MNQKAWLRANDWMASIELQPHLMEIAARLSQIPKAEMLPTRFSLVATDGPVSAWGFCADRIVSITMTTHLFDSIGNTTFPNCTRLYLDGSSEQRIDMKLFPKLKKLYMKNAHECVVTGDVSRLEEFAVVGTPVSQDLVNFVTITDDQALNKYPKIKTAIWDAPGRFMCDRQLEELFYTNSRRMTRLLFPIIVGWERLQVLSITCSAPTLDYIRPIPNLRQLFIICHNLAVPRSTVTLPPCLRKMTKLNKLVINKNIYNWEFIPDHLFFISELHFPNDTQLLLSTRLSDGWCPAIGPVVDRELFGFPICLG